MSAMSYKTVLNDLERDGERSLTDQIVGAIRGAIEAGELVPGEKLPPTRELAETAGINHLTAVRAYKRLARARTGLLAGRPRHVRPRLGARRPARSPATPTATEWQHYVLPPRAESHGDRVMAEMYRHSQVARVDPAVGRAIPRRRCSRSSRSAARSTPAWTPRTPARSSTPTSPASPSWSSSSPPSQPTAAPRGARRPRRHHGRSPGPDPCGAGDPAPRRRGRLRGTDLHGRDRVGEVDRHPGAAGADGRPRGSTSTRSSSCSGASEIRFLAVQPRCHNPTGIDLAPARRGRPARARAPSRLLHRRGRHLRRPPLRRRGPRHPSRRVPWPRDLRRLDLEDGRRWPARGLGRRQRPRSRPDPGREARRRHAQRHPHPARRRRLPRGGRVPGSHRARSRLLP